MNEIFVIRPYRSHGTWVFDDPDADLAGEPFVSGTPELIDRLVADIPDAERGFRLIFTAGDMPDAHTVVEHAREELGGHWYRAPEWDAEGWLCPALFRYFDRAPDRIAVRAEPLHDTDPGAARITPREIDDLLDLLDRADTQTLRARLTDLKQRATGRQNPDH